MMSLDKKVWHHYDQPFPHLFLMFPHLRWSPTLPRYPHLWLPTPPLVTLTSTGHPHLHWSPSPPLVTLTSTGHPHLHWSPSPPLVTLTSTGHPHLHWSPTSTGQPHLHWSPSPPLVTHTSLSTDAQGRLKPLASHLNAHSCAITYLEFVESRLTPPIAPPIGSTRCPSCLPLMCTLYQQSSPGHCG